MSLLERGVGVTAAEVERFLFDEAELLDTWALEEWLGLLEPGATYVVPATDRPGGDPSRDQMLISDDHAQIQARVKRLLSRNAHAENPRSRTRRFISNVRIVAEDASSITVTASFMVHRFKERRSAVYVGQYRHVLATTPEGLRFRSRTAVLDLETLADEGRISFIL